MKARESSPPASPIDVDALLVDASRNGERMQRKHGLSPELRDLLHRAVEQEASDVHLVPGYPPTFRVHGNLRSVGDDPLTAEHVREMAASVIPERSRFQLDDDRDFDCSLALVHNGAPCRFRANVYVARGQWCVCLRNIPDQIPALEWLGFPPDLAQRLTAYKNGLVVITGVTGSGKSATLAALISEIRQNSARRVLTIEEPIEYVHAPGAGGGIVTQREVGRDVDSFADGLKYGLRQDPDVILVGEIRDRETAQIALSAAETGHLIFTTLHTRDAKGAVSRLVDLFPQESQEDIRKQVAMSLRAVVCQHLLPSASPGEKRVLALEVLTCNQQVQVAVRTGKLEMVESAIQTGKRDGMVLLDDELQRLVALGQISGDTARSYAKEPSAILGGGGSARATTVRAM